MENDANGDASLNGEMVKYGKGVKLRDGKDFAVLTIGSIGNAMAEAIDEMSARQASSMSADKPLNDGMMIDGVFADDTGLEIDALGGKPGVYTARWYRMNDEMIAPLNDEMMIFKANRAKALRELEGKEDRGAQFRTVITLIMMPCYASLNDGMVQVEGIVRGRIAEEEFGEGGFGYDPVFIPEGYDKTFGELPASVKNEISHRARALQALIGELKGEK